MVIYVYMCIYVYFKIIGLLVLEKILNLLLLIALAAILVNVTLTIYTNFRFLFLRMLHMKFGFDWPSGFRGKDL